MSGDLTFTSYQSPICFRKVFLGKYVCMQLFETQMAHCRASALIRFNLVVVLFVCDRKFLSIKNRPAGVEQHGGLDRLGCRNS